MLAKYWRLRMLWKADQTLTYNDGARIAIRLSPWRKVSGVHTYYTTITEDMGFGSGETIVDDGEVEGSVNDNTSNVYDGIKGYIQIIADLSSTDGTAYLFIEEADESTGYWPSDQADFDIDAGFFRERS